jgi:GntR family transcriptional regulator / MocR family aminotransferase
MDLVITLDRTSAIPLYQQLAAALRQAVLERRLQPDRQLPPSRVLAASLAISRATVTQSYEQLVSEGYFEARCGAGTFVCARLPDDYLQVASIDSHTEQRSQQADGESGKLPVLSRFGRDLVGVERLEIPEPEAEISFRFGSPAAEHFPIALWRRLLARHCDNSSAILDYSPDPAGYLPLRTAIADYLGRSRAVRCSAEQVIIVNGSQQALDLIARLTLDPGDWVAVEDPSYLGARYCFQGQGARLQAVGVDAAGLDVAALSRYPQPFKLLYVTPSHQFPTGATLSLPRRLALLQWAQQTGTLIVEDDYDSEYRYGARPIPALQGLDRHERVIYVGTFSKILFPSLRIGYLVVPAAWISVVSKAKWLGDRQSPTLEQYALTDCITAGHFERHIRRMRQLYDRHRQVLVDALNYYFGTRVRILGDNAGIHLMAKIETTLPDELVIQQAASVGVGLVSARDYYLTTPTRGEFIFGYARLDKAQIESGIDRLARILLA